MANVIVATGPRTEDLLHTAVPRSDLQGHKPVFVDSFAALDAHVQRHSKECVAGMMDLDLPLGPRKQYESGALFLRISGQNPLMPEGMDRFDAYNSIPYLRREFIGMYSRVFPRRSMIAATQSEDFVRYVRHYPKPMDGLVSAVNIVPGACDREESIRRTVRALNELALAIGCQKPERKPNRYVAYSRDLRRYVDMLDAQEEEYEQKLVAIQGITKTVMELPSGAETLPHHNNLASVMDWMRSLPVVDDDERNIKTLVTVPCALHAA